MSNVLNFLMSNSTLLVALLVALVGLISAIVSRKKQKMYAEIYNLICDAQQLENSNTEKFGYVFNLAYNRLPKLFRLFISKDDIARAIEYSLNKLKAFAKARSVYTSIEAISDAAAINTNIQSPADIAVNTEQNVTPTETAVPTQAAQEAVVTKIQ